VQEPCEGCLFRFRLAGGGSGEVEADRNSEAPAGSGRKAGFREAHGRSADEGSREASSDKP
jgi:hypothetical protein